MERVLFIDSIGFLPLIYWRICRFYSVATLEEEMHIRFIRRKTFLVFRNLRGLPLTLFWKT
jgi:hypothetical protein